MCPNCGNTRNNTNAKRCSKCKKVTCNNCSFTGCPCGSTSRDKSYIIKSK